jgi:putative Ig domain-containing protein
MSINPSSGLISWTPGAAGSFDVAVDVSDGKGGAAKAALQSHGGAAYQCVAEGQRRPRSDYYPAGDPVRVARQVGEHSVRGRGWTKNDGTTPCTLL